MTIDPSSSTWQYPLSFPVLSCHLPLWLPPCQAVDLFLYQSSDVTPVSPQWHVEAPYSTPVWAKCPPPTCARLWHQDGIGSHHAASYRTLWFDSWVRLLSLGWKTPCTAVLSLSCTHRVSSPYPSAHKQSLFLVSISTRRNHISAVLCFCIWLFGLNCMTAGRVSLSPLATTWHSEGYCSLAT